MKNKTLKYLWDEEFRQKITNSDKLQRGNSISPPEVPQLISEHLRRHSTLSHKIVNLMQFRYTICFF